MKKYKEQAEQLIKANFRVFGIGHFDVCLDEVEVILEFLDKKKYKLLRQFYEKLSKQRLD